MPVSFCSMPYYFDLFFHFFELILFCLIQYLQLMMSLNKSRMKVSWEKHSCLQMHVEVWLWWRGEPFQHYQLEKQCWMRWLIWLRKTPTGNESHRPDFWNQTSGSEAITLAMDGLVASDVYQLRLHVSLFAVVIYCLNILKRIAPLHGIVVGSFHRVVYNGNKKSPWVILSVQIWQWEIMLQLKMLFCCYNFPVQ